MPVKLSEIMAIARGICVDRVEAAITPAFTDEEIIRAINLTVGGFFGMRPEAFHLSAISTEPPAAIPEIGRPALSFLDASPESGVIPGTIQTGKINLDFKSNGNGPLYCLTYQNDNLDDAGYIELSVESGGLRLLIQNTIDAIDILDLLLPGTYGDFVWHTVEVSNAAGVLSLSVDQNIETAAYAGALIPMSNLLVLGYSTARSAQFTGYMANLVMTGTDGTPFGTYKMDDGSGTVIADSSTNGINGNIASTGYAWVTDTDFPICPWAVQQFCYGVAASLLIQRSKDSFFRKAAAEVNQLYMGR